LFGKSLQSAKRISASKHRLIAYFIEKPCGRDVTDLILAGSLENYAIFKSKAVIDILNAKVVVVACILCNFLDRPLTDCFVNVVE
jgi:hypothetical protein